MQLCLNFQNISELIIYWILIANKLDISGQNIENYRVVNVELFKLLFGLEFKKMSSTQMIYHCNF